MATMKAGQGYMRYNAMPVLPVMENMVVFDGGSISIGVESRLLNAEIVASLGLSEVVKQTEYNITEDSGVSLHVYAKADGGDFERLRFDCFRNDPHYHYISMKQKHQDVIHLDPVVNEDVLGWALDNISKRLPRMLARADVDDAEQLVAASDMARILPQVVETAHRAARQMDEETIRQNATSQEDHVWETGASRSWENAARL